MRRPPEYSPLSTHSMGLKWQHSKHQLNQSRDRKPEGSGEKLSNELIHPKIVQETTKAEKLLASLLNTSQMQCYASVPSVPKEKGREQSMWRNFCKCGDSLLTLLVNILFKSAKC